MTLAARAVGGTVRGLVAFGVAVTLAVSLALALFAHPNGDDFCVAVEARELGFWGCVRQGYSIQGGRWAAYAAACGIDSSVELVRGYPWLLLGNWLFALFAVWFLLDSLPGFREDRRFKLGLVLCFAALYWAGTPFPGESLYFLDGAYVYSFNLSVCLLLVGGLLRLPSAATGGSRGRTLILAVGVFVVAAFHELVTLALGGVLFGGAVVTFLRGDRRRWAWLGATAAAGFGLLTVAVAPGNEVRARGALPVEQSVGRALVTGLQMIVRILDAPVTRGETPGSHGSPLGWVLDAKLLAASLLFASSARIRALRPAWLAEDLGTWRVVIPAVWIALLLGSLLAGGYALGRTLPLRAFNALYLVFLLGWFATLLVYSRADEEGREAAPLSGPLRVASAAVLALALVASTPVKHGLRDLGKGWVPAYDHQMRARYAAAELLRGEGGGALVVQAVEPWPSSYYANDIEEDPAHLRNECLARYLEVDSIRLAGPSRSPGPGSGSRDEGRPGAAASGAARE